MGEQTNEGLPKPIENPTKQPQPSEAPATLPKPTIDSGAVKRLIDRLGGTVPQKGENK